MTRKIAVAGKGGTGKTTLASLIIRDLSRSRNKSILAIDADPNSNLAQVLGVEEGDTIGDIAEEVKNRETFPSGMSRTEYLSFKVQELVKEEKGFDLLTMGRPEGPGCYCGANNILRFSLQHLARSYEYLVIDNEAGMEHLSRKTDGEIDVLLVTSDPTFRGLRIARDIMDLVEKIGIPCPRKYLVLNRLTGEVGRLRKKIEELGLDLVGTIPEDEEVKRFDAEGKPLLRLPEDSPAPKAAAEITREIIRRVE